MDSAPPNVGPGSTSASANTEDAIPKTGKKKMQRVRPSLSCVECIRRKIKCDREQPCTPCTKRSVSAGETCSFRYPNHTINSRREMSFSNSPQSQQGQDQAGSLKSKLSSNAGDVSRSPSVLGSGIGNGNGNGNGNGYSNSNGNGNGYGISNGSGQGNGKLQYHHQMNGPIDPSLASGSQGNDGYASKPSNNLTFLPGSNTSAFFPIKQEPSPNPAHPPHPPTYSAPAPTTDFLGNLVSSPTQMNFNPAFAFGAPATGDAFGFPDGFKGYGGYGGVGGTGLGPGPNGQVGGAGGMAGNGNGDGSSGGPGPSTYGRHLEATGPFPGLQGPQNNSSPANMANVTSEGASFGLGIASAGHPQLQGWANSGVEHLTSLLQPAGSWDNMSGNMANPAIGNLTSGPSPTLASFSGSTRRPSSSNGIGSFKAPHPPSSRPQPRRPSSGHESDEASRRKKRKLELDPAAEAGVRVEAAVYALEDLLTEGALKGKYGIGKVLAETGGGEDLELEDRATRSDANSRQLPNRQESGSSRSQSETPISVINNNNQNAQDRNARLRAAQRRYSRSEAPDIILSPTQKRLVVPPGDPSYDTLLDDVFAALPRNEVVMNDLVDWYFDKVAWHWHLLHKGLFMEEYKAFIGLAGTKQRRDVDPLWLSCLLMVLALSLDSFDHMAGPIAALGTPTEISTMSFSFFKSAISALECGDWQGKPRMRSVQAVALMGVYSIFLTRAGALERISKYNTSAIYICHELEIFKLSEDPEHMPPEDPAFPVESSTLRREVAIRLAYALLTIDQLMFRRRPVVGLWEVECPLPGNYDDVHLTPGSNGVPRPAEYLTEAAIDILRFETVRLQRKFHQGFFIDKDFAYDDLVSLDSQILDLIERYGLQRPQRAETTPQRWMRLINLFNLNIRRLRFHRPFLNADQRNPRYVFSRNAAQAAARVVLNTGLDLFKSGAPLVRGSYYLLHLQSAIVVLIQEGWSDFGQEFPMDGQVLHDTVEVFKSYTDSIRPSVRRAARISERIVQLLLDATMDRRRFNGVKESFVQVVKRIFRTIKQEVDAGEPAGFIQQMRIAQPTLIPPVNEFQGDPPIGDNVADAWMMALLNPLSVNYNGLGNV